MARAETHDGSSQAGRKARTLRLNFIRLLSYNRARTAHASLAPSNQPGARKKMKRSIIIKGVILALLLFAPSLCPAKDGWTSLRTKNFTVIGNAGEDEMRKVAIRLEQFRYVLSLLFPQAKVETPVPTTIILFKSHSSFNPYKPKYKGKTKENVGGYFLPSADVNYVALTTDLRSAEPLEVMFHEYEHFIVNNNLSRIPVWLNEGLAEFYSTFDSSEGDQKFKLGNPIARHLMTLRDTGLLPLKTLLTVDQRSPYYNESSKAGIFYAQSWALVHYLILGQGGKRQPQLTQFINQLSTNMPVEENFRQSFQTDYGKIEDELREYIEKRSFPILNIKFPNQLDLVKELQSAPMTEAEVLAHLGDLLVRSNRLDEAEEHLKKAIALDPKLAAGQVSMGILRLRQDQTAEAKKMFEAAMALDQRNYLAHSYYAQLLRDEGKYEEALKSYKEALRLKPELPRLHAELGFTYLSLGRDREANEAFRQVTSRKQNDSLFYMDRSQRYLRAAQGAHAATAAFIYLIQQGWNDSHSPYMALSAHFGYRQAKRDADAARILKEAVMKTAASEWPHPVLRYLQREIPAAQLLALATDNNKQTEAYAYIGMDMSLSGNRDAAMAHLRWVRDKGNKNFYEYPLALAELARLEGSTASAP